jgi:hypothetical protein
MSTSITLKQPLNISPFAARQLPCTGPPKVTFSTGNGSAPQPRFTEQFSPLDDQASADMIQIMEAAEAELQATGKQLHNSSELQSIKNALSSSWQHKALTGYSGTAMMSPHLLPPKLSVLFLSRLYPEGDVVQLFGGCMAHGLQLSITDSTCSLKVPGQQQRIEERVRQVTFTGDPKAVLEYAVHLAYTEPLHSVDVTASKAARSFVYEQQPLQTTLHLGHWPGNVRGADKQSLILPVNAILEGGGSELQLLWKQDRGAAVTKAVTTAQQLYWQELLAAAQQLHPNTPMRQLSHDSIRVQT